MKAIIPVAGHGTRLQPHTFSLPKPLIPVAGKPILDHVLAPLQSVALDEVIFVVGVMADKIEKHVTENSSFNARFVIQRELLGLGYAINMAMAHVEDDDSLLIILGDTIVTTELDKLTSYGRHALGVRKVEDPTRFGIVEIADGLVVGLEEKPEKPKTDLALIGLYYLTEARGLKRALAELVDSGKTTRGEVQLTDALAIMLEGGERFVPQEVADWYDCGKKETLIASNRHLLNQMGDSPRIDGSVVKPPVYVAPDARVDGSVIGPHVSIGAGTRVSGSVISDSIIGDGAEVRDAILTESILGPETNVVGFKSRLNIGKKSEAHLG